MYRVVIAGTGASLGADSNPSLGSKVGRLGKVKAMVEACMVRSWEGDDVLTGLGYHPTDWDAGWVSRSHLCRSRPRKSHSQKRCTTKKRFIAQSQTAVGLTN